MTDKIREIKKAVLRLMLALAIGVLAGAAPGAVLVSHAETETVAAADAAAVAAETASEDDGTTFMLSFFGGIILLILFVVVVVIATATSTAGVVGAQEDE